MKVVLPGASGQVGHLLCRALTAAGHEVVVLSRSPGSGPWRTIGWDGRTLGTWRAEIEGAGAVINLAGRSVNCRYTPANRAAMMASRVDSTRDVGQAIAAARQPPAVWLQASTATIYAHRFDAGNDEATGIIGGSEPDAPVRWRFSIEVARAWEHELEHAHTPATRRVAMRTAMVMSPDRGGIFDVMLGLVRAGLGGAAGSGRQFVSWIHGEDFVRVVGWLLTHDHLAGPINVTAPNPVPNADFMRALRRAWGARLGLPATEWMLHVGTMLMRTETELVLKSRRVVPGRLQRENFPFLFPTWPIAAQDLCRQWQARRGTVSSM